MKKFLILLLLPLLFSCNQGEKIKTNLPKPTKPDDKASYLMGYDIGRQMMRDSLKVNMDYLILGFRNAFRGDSTFVTNRELDSFRVEFQKMLLAKQDERMKQEEQRILEQAPKNLAAGQAFLDSNKKKPGVITTPSGLQYIVLREGKGRIPKETDFVKMHVRAQYLDGKEFDNTYPRGPVTLSVAQLVPGWKEAITHMKEGSIWRIFVPPHLGWGEKGAPPTIPPNATLIFELELLSIEKPDAGAQPGQGPQ
ncbi:FKBP-type peptidyl-prolyl cis-trans isomerase [Bacteroidetes/Chlorobi group bacterium MS-B_bin-24]|nr:MAG: FKBP-type peptidyl-prolyl cis-trans isomerase [Bacteroidetes/Chlorobi group bacterium MS-B_bin-24]